jgi:DNA-binding transcriptional MerR regulator
MDIEGEFFTAARVVQITGVPYQTLNHWVKIGLVKSSISPARGSGSRRVYSFQDLASVFVALKLRRAGIYGKAMVRILEVLRKAGFDSPAQVAIDTTPHGEVIVSPSAGERIGARKHPGQLLLNWDCRGAVAELRGLLRAVELPRVKKAIKKGVTAEQCDRSPNQHSRRTA